MANEPHFPGFKLPTHPTLKKSRETQGFFTPVEDLIAQVHSVLPMRVLPIIFLPGIMGSNLRMTAERQKQMGRKANIAWRPDSIAEAERLLRGNAAMRQTQLDPQTTEVDVYDPLRNPTGDVNETADTRHDVIKVKHNLPLEVGINSPLLMDDPITARPRKSKAQKARERGWGEVFYKSYQTILEMCEQRLNTAFSGGKLDSWWTNIVNVPPIEWQAHSQPNLSPLDESALRKAVTNCWFPVHAMGYNWLESNRRSGIRVAERINHLIRQYQDQGFRCEKVIIVTHSMGGLVARALIHPKIGNMNEKVLGVVHGVMPAIGAGAAYKRMRCGFEDPGLVSLSPIASVTAKVLGNFGPEVTAVLGNAPGGLELLPSQAYGNNWLRVTHRGKTLKSLPKNADPYEEIYKLRGKWFGLLREEWINPAETEFGSSFENTCAHLDQAKAFHNEIACTYHDNSFAHYGADLKRAAWHKVVWDIAGDAEIANVEALKIVSDDGQGSLCLIAPGVQPSSCAAGPKFMARMQGPCDAGDQTVPLHSAEHQLQSGKFRGVFRQSGYEHQDSYKDDRALRSTLYSLVQIAQRMTWAE
ncbi:esterase/lipase family protein [Massilia sp. GCM10020059]|uniref:GPI inositol-deacylase n=1 Tax=Massilia agrisoli TaxID=2892444 RepID=A0ABS8IST6_9BURK|nr:GPI inositol-deacylase [Massilia agrisoli]MCC6071664.1 GPI inositol-deacylase [Massilia agrisoli]